MTWLRALATAVLSVIMPGAGHALIRDWVRAVAFAGVFVASAVVFLLPSADKIAAAESMTAMMDVVNEETTTTSQFLLSFIVLFAAIDATFRAVGTPTKATADEGPTCPECGKALDEDLEFCHWCTARLERTAPEEDGPASP